MTIDASAGLTVVELQAGLDGLPGLELVEPTEPPYRPANFVRGYERLRVRAS